MATACQNKEKNLAGCNCTYDCGKKGICCECVTYHRSMGQIPACFFTDEGEALWDRSVQTLCKDRGCC